jgi:hypothetical protein
VTLSDERKQQIQAVAEALLTGRIGETIAVTLPEELRLVMRRESDRVVVEWPDSENPEISLPGLPDPDIVRLILTRDQLGIQLGLGTVWMDYR